MKTCKLPKLLLFAIVIASVMLHGISINAQTIQRFEIDKFSLEAIEIGDGKHGVVLVHGAAVSADYFFGKYTKQFG